jgi:alpha-beta hydrolase superfamily lysophospholipase
MPNVRFLEIAGAEHEILMERDVFRDQLWAAFDDFTKKSAPAVAR